MKKHLLLLVFLSCTATLAAQHNGKRLWGGVELGSDQRYNVRVSHVVA